jgi:hypothetical protein
MRRFALKRIAGLKCFNNLLLPRSFDSLSLPVFQQE